jgi:hypothetical protein
LPGAVCAAMTGQTYLAEVLKRLSEKLNCVWTCAYITSGDSDLPLGLVRTSGESAVSVACFSFLWQVAKALGGK